MGKEGEGSSQGTCIRDPWTKTAEGEYGLNVGGSGWVGQGRIKGENGDNFK